MLPFILVTAFATTAPQWKVQLEEVTLWRGQGRAESASPDELRARLRLSGQSSKATPRIRAWKIQADHLPSLEKGLPLSHASLGATPIKITLQAVPDGFQLSGTWEGPLLETDRLVVEVTVKGHRRIWTFATIREVRRRESHLDPK